MADFVVVCFRAPDPTRAAADHLSEARAVSERAAALGGRLVSWGTVVVGFAFDPDAFEDALELALSTARAARPGSSFAVGISSGSLEHADDATARVPLAWGPALLRAAALAESAQQGEVVVDSEGLAAHPAAVGARGERIGQYGEVRIRGTVLDPAEHGRREELPIAVTLRPRLVGCPPEGLAVAPGCLGVIRADPGHGGTRLLQELAWAAQGRAMILTPQLIGEPLGALRRAFRRAVSGSSAAATFDRFLLPSLECLLGGEGLDPDSSAELLLAWLMPESEAQGDAVVLVDDAREVDADSLDVIRLATLSAVRPFRIIVRVREDGELPRALAGIPVAAELRLGPLSHTDATTFARSLTAEPLERRAAARWGNRGGGIPLGIMEAVRSGLESEDLVLTDGHLREVGKGTSGVARPVEDWIELRWRRLPPRSRVALQALAVLGGEAEDGEIGALVDELESDGNMLEAQLKELESSGWLVRLGSGFVAFSSRSQRDTTLSALSPEELRRWHAGASRVLGRQQALLAAAPAAVHAMLGGDESRASELAKIAAASARAAGLEDTAHACEALARAGDPRGVAARQLVSSDRLGDALAGTGSTGSIRPSAPPPSASPRAVEALRVGDIEAVRSLLEQLRSDGGRDGLADRLEAIATLAQGHTADAVRRLRRAADEARRDGSPERCRAALALALALSAAHRNGEALLEVLDALARAREAGDRRGEKACARFVAQLAEKVGQPEVARQWQVLAEGE